MRNSRRQSFEMTQYIAPDGAVYNMDTGDRFVMTEEGLGMPDIKYNTSKGPNQHGESYLGYRLEPRIIQYLHRVNGCSRENYWANRANLLNLVRPNRQINNGFQAGKLRKIFLDGRMRDIDVFLLEGPKFGPRDLDLWDEWGFAETLRFVAPNPTFYDPTTKTVNAAYSPSAYLTFPFSFYNSVTGSSLKTLVFASAMVDATVMCVNAGTWPTFPTINITGPAAGVHIVNTITSELIQLNYDVPTGLNVRIDLTFGNKRVYMVETGWNLIGNVSTDSDLSTFHLEPEPGATGGANPIHVTSGNVSVGTTVFTITWNDRFIGI